MGEGKRHTSPGSSESPQKVVPNEAYTILVIHIITKMSRLQDKERILKITREKQVVTFKGAPIRLSWDYSADTFQTRREWSEIVKVMKSKGLQPGLLYPAKLSFKIEGEIRSFLDKKKLKEFVNTKPVLQQMLKGLLEEEEEKEKEETKNNRRRKDVIVLLLSFKNVVRLISTMEFY